MAKVMCQRRDTNDLPISREVLPRHAELGSKDLHATTANGIEEPGCDLHHAKGMCEPSMHCARIDHIGPGELPDPAKALERRRVDNVPFEFVQRDESVYGIPYFELPTHSSTSVALMLAVEQLLVLVSFLDK